MVASTSIRWLPESRWPDTFTGNASTGAGASRWSGCGCNGISRVSPGRIGSDEGANA
jgi:hypothetical protein